MAVFVDVALRNPPVVLVSVLALVGTRALVGLFYAAVPPTAAALVAAPQEGSRPRCPCRPAAGPVRFRFLFARSAGCLPFPKENR